MYIYIYIIIFFYFDVFFTKSLLSTGSIHFFLFHLHISEARSLQRGGKRCLSLRGGFWTAMAIGLERNCLDTQQIRADPRNLGQKAEQKQPKIWFCVHHLVFFWEFSMGLKQQRCGLYLIIWMNLITWLFSITGMMIGMGNHHGSSPNARTFSGSPKWFWENMGKWW